MPACLRATLCWYLEVLHGPKPLHPNQPTKSTKRRHRDAERLSGMDQLLSEYQKAIDALTRRAKAADAAFAGVCQVRKG